MPRRSLPPSRPCQKEPSGDLRFVSLRGSRLKPIDSLMKTNTLQSCLVVRKVRAALPLTGVRPCCWGKGALAFPSPPHQGTQGVVGG